MNFKYTYDKYRNAKDSSHYNQILSHLFFAFVLLCIFLLCPCLKSTYQIKLLKAKFSFFYLKSIAIFSINNCSLDRRNSIRNLIFWSKV